MLQRQFLLKLAHLGLEVQESYNIILKLKQGWDFKQALGHHYPTFINLDATSIETSLKNLGINYVTLIDCEYPSRLKNIYMPPLVLFYQGDLALTKQKTLAVIGSRIHTDYGRSCCEYFVSGMVSYGVVIVSGLARGIDGLAHEVAIRNGGHTIAVLGSGLRVIYPKEHLKLAKEIATNHLILSEYPPFEAPKKTHFPFRNRIVSGLSDGILVIEAQEKSGTLITCDFGLEQGKEIYAVPGSIFSNHRRGVHRLIQQGAKLVTTVNDIFEDYDDY